MSKTLEIEYVNPHRLTKNPWNPNEVDPINQDKIVESIRRNGFFKPIICRELSDGTLEILGGEHRVLAAISLEMQSVPVINHGEVDDVTAKKMGLLDNGRYGEDNAEKMADLLPDLGSAEDLLQILDIDAAEYSAYFEHATMSDDDFDKIVGDESQDEIDLAPAVSAIQTHTITRFKLTIEDAETLTEVINKVKATQGFTDADTLTNDGNALMHLLREVAA